MPLTIAIQMDPIECIDIYADSSFILAVEAQSRGHKLFYYTPDRLSFLDGEIVARARPLEVRFVKDNHFTLGEEEKINLAELDVVLMRQDPPFDMAYITATHFLEKVHPRTLVINDPAHVRNAPEKILVTQFKDFIPPTLISSDRQSIREFVKKYQDIVIKPLYGNGGKEIFHIKPQDENLTALLEMFAEKYREPIITQLYIPDVRKGDKRIILIDGKPVGGVLRVPSEGEIRANFHTGGEAQKTSLTQRERKICEAIGPDLSERGLFFVGIDVIGDYLTEINVTSPTGIQEINRLNGINIEKMFWNSVELRIGEIKAGKQLK
ncbi:MAG: glutathione synthase [Rhodospirillaceae bacterium]|nr:glutathione synthase [Rhodospirillaceae bacterium]|tara:strand:- start:197 stop:1165 length:969 start_codon:yes stop_codon:yes gene_type:complete